MEGNTTPLLGWSSVPASRADGSALPGVFPAAPTKCHPAKSFVAGPRLSLQECGQQHTRNYNKKNSAFSSQGNDERVLSVLTERVSYFPTFIFSFFVNNSAELTGALSSVQGPCEWLLTAGWTNICQE